MADEKILDPEFAGFFDHLRQGKVAFPQCRSCGRLHWYPMKRCPHCRSADIGWTPIAGRGEIWSWTVVRHAFDPAFTAELPYAVAVITFADAPGIRLVANIVDTALDTLYIGMPVEPVPPQTDAPMRRVRFRPTG